MLGDEECSASRNPSSCPGVGGGSSRHSLDSPMGKSQVGRAVPEMFDLTSPWEGLPTAFVETKHSPLHPKEKELRERLRLPAYPKLQDVLLQQMLERPARLMWEHNGKCMCGRRTFLHGLCDKCAREDAIDRHQAASQEPEPDSREVLEDADATLDPVVTDESIIAADATVVDPILCAPLRPAGTPVFLTDQQVS